MLHKPKLHRAKFLSDCRTDGHAYLVVVVITAAVLVVAVTAFTVSAGSRDASARHRDFFALYDLAVAANAQTFSDIQLPNWESAFVPHPNVATGALVRNWSLSANFPGAPGEFLATTTVEPLADGFYIETRIWPVVEGAAGHHTQVRRKFSVG